MNNTDENPGFAAGSLWTSTRRVTLAAATSGALCPVATQTLTLTQDGVPFVVRMLGNIARKQSAGSRRLNMASGGKEAPNPFLPYDPELFVARLSRTHIALLNKYNVLDHHLLLVTRTFEHQEHLLTQTDFEAAWIGLSEVDGLVFYNGGLAAGASQPHKHLQLVALPLGEHDNPVPLAQHILTTEVGRYPTRSTGLPFPHAVCRADPGWVDCPSEAATESLRLYRIMLQMLDIGSVARAGGLWQSRPYNLLLTRDWMLLVPRTLDAVEGVPVNALAYAGAMLVKDRAGLDRLRSLGAMTVLQRAGSAPL